MYKHALIMAMIVGLLTSSALAGEGGVEDNYTRDWIDRAYGDVGLPLVSAAYDSLPGSHRVYGQLRASSGYNRYDYDGDMGLDKAGSLQLDNQASILGVRGWLGNDDIKGVYNAQFGLNYDANPVLTRRFAWAGIKHARAGQVIGGTTSTPYKMPAVRLDPFYNTAAGLANGGANYGLSRYSNGFVNNSIEYKTPAFGGFSANGAIYIDDSTADDHSANAGVSYGSSSFDGGVQYLHATPGTGLNAAGDVDMFRAHGKLKGDGFSLGGTYELESNDGAPDVNYVYVAGTYDPCDDWTLAGSFGYTSDGPTEGIGGAVGAFYELLSGIHLYGVVSHVDLDAATAGTPTRTSATVGMNIAFGVGDK